MRVPVRPEAPEDVDCRTGRPTSSLRLSMKMVNGINHQAGYVLGGLRHHQQYGGTGSPGGSDHEIVIRLWRNPNCDYIDVWLLLSLTSMTPASITAQAGSGSSQLIIIDSDVTTERELVIRLPWDSSDSGYENVTIDTNSNDVKCSSIWDVPREELGSGDDGAELLDGTYSTIGLTEGRAIAESDTSGPDGLAQELYDAWDNHRQMGATWWSPYSVWTNSTSWTNPFTDDFTFPHRGRALRASETTRYYSVFVRCSFDGTGTYQVRCTSSNGTVTSTTYSNATKAWIELEDVEVNCDSDDELEIEVRRYSGTGYVDVWGVLIGEAVDPEV